MWSHENRGTDTAGLQVRQHMMAAKEQNQSAAAIFVDVVGAFDSVHRTEIFQGNMSAEMSDLGIDEDLIRQAASAHRQTWTVTDGMPEASETTQGVRPGDAYGSMMFNILMAKVLGKIDEELKEKGIRLRLPAASRESLCSGEEEQEEDYAIDVSFVDDGTFLLLDKASKPA